MTFSIFDLQRPSTRIKKTSYRFKTNKLVLTSRYYFNMRLLKVDFLLPVLPFT